MKLKTLLLDVYRGFGAPTSVEDELNAFYEQLDCRCIDIVCLRIGGKTFDVMCDDEGLFRENPRVSAATNNGNVLLVGNLMFFHHDDEGNLTGLDDAEIVHLMKNTGWLATMDEEGEVVGGHPVITNCEYSAR